MLTSCVSSSAKTIAGERRAHRAAEDRAHADQRPEAGALERAGTSASRPPSAPPIISSGASTPPEVPEPSETAQIDRLDEQDAEDDLARRRRPAAARRWCRSRRRAPAGRCRPPRPMTRPPIAGHHIQWIGRLLEGVFRGVDALRQQRRERAGEQARRRTQPSEPCGPMKAGCGGTGKSGPRPRM